MTALVPVGPVAAQTITEPERPAIPPSPPQRSTRPPAPVTPYVNARYRIETVEQAGFAESAAASTLRIRAGLRTAVWQGLSAVIEGEAIILLGPDDYNDTANGQMAFPVVADAPDVLLNQAFVRWQPIAEGDAVAGRQAVNFDNQRWVGSVDWRQNDQTLDLVRIGFVPTSRTRFDYIYSWQVNRVFGPDSPQGTWRDSDLHLLRGSTMIDSVGAVTAYGYWLNIPAASAMSSQTFGVRLAGEQSLGSHIKLHYVAEYAHQSDHGVNPNRFSHDYLLVEPGISVGPVTARVGFERLSGDGRTALQTPLATLHLFNGWADKFLVTPANGLRDLYVDVQWRIGPILTAAPATLRLQFHDFNATRSAVDYGREFGAWLVVPVSSQITSSVKIAHYDADRFAGDTTKFWLSVDARF